MNGKQNVCFCMTLLTKNDNSTKCVWKIVLDVSTSTTRALNRETYQMYQIFNTKYVDR